MSKNIQFVAKTMFGLEETLAVELKNIGAENIEILNRAVSFTGDKSLMYRANLYLRTALRVLFPIRQFRVSDEEDLYRKVKAIQWDKYLSNDQNFAIDSAVNSAKFTHSKYVALKTKDAIADYFREKTGSRPDVELDNPNVRINIHISNNDCTISLDSSGESLHKRGYRIAINEAPINEVLAAGMIIISGWHGENNFVDPMCGSGTLLIEAALIAKNIAPGLIRKTYGFKNWNDFDEELWKNLIIEAEQKINSNEPKLFGSDISARNIEIANGNIEVAGLKKYITLTLSSFDELIPPQGDGLLITNPPYGERMPVEEIDSFYSKIGDKFKKDFKGYNAWIITSNKDALKRLGLRPSRRVTLFNGPLECKFHKFELYEGSRKSKYRENP